MTDQRYEVRKADDHFEVYDTGRQEVAAWLDTEDEAKECADAFNHLYGLGIA